MKHYLTCLLPSLLRYGCLWQEGHPLQKKQWHYAGVDGSSTGARCKCCTCVSSPLAAAKSKLFLALARQSYCGFRAERNVVVVVVWRVNKKKLSNLFKQYYLHVSHRRKHDSSLWFSWLACFIHRVTKWTEQSRMPLEYCCNLRMQPEQLTGNLWYTSKMTVNDCCHKSCDRSPLLVMDGLLHCVLANLRHSVLWSVLFVHGWVDVCVCASATTITRNCVPRPSPNWVCRWR